MTEPKLQPPGAGLPWVERLIARHFVFPRACRISWAEAGSQFQEEGAKVLDLWDATPADRLGERVLIRRLAGLEDSSRYWSVAMTVEHLVIVGQAVRGAIAALRRGEVPGTAARTADVKPQGVTAAEVRSDFAGLLAEAAESDRSEPAILPGVGPRYPHPWFGPLDAHQWHCMLAFHQGLHRRQIEAIRAGLGRP